MDGEDRLAEVKVGAFVLVALVIFVIGSLWIAGSSLGSGGASVYRVLMKDSGGVEIGDRVRVAGVDVGRVDDVALRVGEERPVAFSVSIRDGIDIRTDASARISQTGLLGSNYLQIDPGSPGGTRLEPGGDILGEEAFGLEQAMEMMDHMAGEAGSLMSRTASILDKVAEELPTLLDRLESLVSEENADHVHAILAGLEETIGEARPQIASLLSRLDSISTKMEEPLEGLPDLIDNANGLVADLQSALGPDGSRLARVMEAAESGLSSAEGVLSTIDANSQDLDMTMRNLHLAAANLKEVSQLIKERPFSLIRIKPEPDRRPGDGAQGRQR